MSKNSRSRTMSLFNYLGKTLIIVLPLAVLISFLTGKMIGIDKTILIPYLATNTTIALILVLLASTRNYFRYVKPSVTFVDILRKIVANHDLTSRINKISKAEIGEIERYFNLFIDDIQFLMKNISITTSTLNKTSNEFTQIANRIIDSRKSTNEKTVTINSTIGDIARKIEENAAVLAETSDNMKNVTNSVSSISETSVNLAAVSSQASTAVSQVTGIVEQISGNINNVSSSAKDVSSSVNSVALAVKEINLSLSEINKNCERSIHITSDAEQNAKDTTGIIKRLNESSNQIGQIVSVINDIADQTNMLALNAAVQAAGSGEAGKRFAIVANEIKDLAKQTADATDEISAQIEGMQESMIFAVKAVATINEVIEEITTITNTIAAAVTEQTAITGDISNAVIKAAEKASYITADMEAVAFNARNVTGSLSEALAGVRDLAKTSRLLSADSGEVLKNTENAYLKIQNVTETTYEISQGTNAIAQNMNEINEASNEITAATVRTGSYVDVLAGMAVKLENLVKQYKI